nr:hypothetical protein [Tanacetum cinerariifolium]
MTAGGLSDGAGLELEVPNEQKGKFIDTSEGTGLKPEQSDDERTKFDNDKSVDLKKTDDEEETQDDELVHTPENYVPIDDETDDVDDEEYDCINEEMHSDVNVELKDSKREGEGKDDEEMTDTCHVDAEHENVNQEVVGRQTQGYASNARKNQALRERVVNPVENARENQPRVIKCYNSNGEGHIAKECTAKKTVKDSEWFKDEMLLDQAHKAGVVLNDEQQDFLADSLEETDDCDDL